MMAEVPEVTEAHREVLRRMHRSLESVYHRSDSGKYDWKDLRTDRTVPVEVEILRRHPECWRRYIREAQWSRHSWTVLQRLVAELAENSWADLVVDPAQGPRRPGEWKFSPLYAWSLGVATGKIRAPAKKGPDPGAQNWRDLLIFFTVRDLKDGGLKKSSAIKLVAAAVDLGERRVRQICARLARIETAGKR